ncbi:hypothetical protein F4782DRAFT_448749 [Xylaria castorea]|nr:hypothetical protein F4782DRAFT_448749 [Xylaria castorea]
MATLDIIRPTAEMPLMPIEMARLVGRLDRGDSMSAIFVDIMSNGMVSCIEDEKWFGEHADAMWELLHTMSRPFLRCVLTKTLGPDLYDKHIFSQKNWENVLDIDGPGAYVMFSFIRDRKGRWLCGSEIKTLVSMMTDYRAAVDVCIRRREQDAYGGSQLTGEEKRVLGKAMKIDDAERTNKHHLTLDDLDRFNPRFESRSTGSGFITQLIAMLERRCLQHLDQGVWQYQSPLMVGNAGNMKKRIVDHVPNNSLSKTPKVWGLLLSCMCVMGLPYEVQAAPLFRAWVDARQLNVAEVLGTVLAGSLISVAGLNVKQPGTRDEDARTDTYGYLNGKKHVFAAKTWFKENLELSLRESDRIRKIQGELDVRNAELEELEEEEGGLVNEEKALQKKLQDAMEKLHRATATLEREAMVDKALLAATDEKAQAAEKFLAAYDNRV